MSQIHNKNSIKQGRSPVHLITDYWILIPPLILSGCMGVYEGGFECPPGKGLGCTSISEVNKAVDQCYREQSCGVAEMSDPTRPNKTSQIWFNPRFGQLSDSESSCPSKPIQPEVWNAKNSV